MKTLPIHLPKQNNYFKQQVQALEQGRTELYHTLEKRAEEMSAKEYCQAKEYLTHLLREQAFYEFHLR